jgi:hypothetical protein
MLFSFPPSFFWHGFLFVRWVQLLYFFFLSFKKNKIVHVRWLTKNMTKKWRATPHSSPPLGLLAVPRGVGWGTFGEDYFIF